MQNYKVLALQQKATNDALKIVIAFLLRALRERDKNKEAAG